MSMKSEIYKALKFYELEPPIKNQETINKKYKKLTLKYHPDVWWNDQDFILLGKYKDILEKNFDKINNINFTKDTPTNVVFYDEVRKYESPQKNKNTWKKKKSFLNKIFEYISNIVLQITAFLLKYFLLISIHTCLFIFPFSFHTIEHNKIINPSYTEEGYITDNKEVWAFEGNVIRYLWKYNEIFERMDLQFYNIEKLEERKKLLNEIMVKWTLIYLAILITYSLIYFKILKKMFKKGIKKSKKYIWNKTLIKAISYYRFYYFIFLYLTSFFIYKIILFSY